MEEELAQDRRAKALGSCARTDIAFKFLNVALEEGFAANGIASVGPSGLEAVRERRRMLRRF